jgi:hypothetical protein
VTIATGVAGTRLDYVKGHCGWDTVTLVPAGQIPAERELEAALEIMRPPIDGGLEVGWLSPGDGPGRIRLRMVASTVGGWITMCGGMTQVIGKALVETGLGARLGIDPAPDLEVVLVTDAGDIPVRVAVEHGRVAEVTTVMDRYVEHVRELGIEPLTIRGTPLLRVGKYAVFDIADLESAHPGLDFTRRDPGAHLDVLHELLREFRVLVGDPGVNGMLFDDRPEGPGDFRVFPRFYSDDLAAARIPWEFQCGTGGIAVAVALAHRGRLPFTDGVGTVLLEWGSIRVTPDPYGIRTSKLELELSEGELRGASFSHSVVEVTSEGRLFLATPLPRSG